MLSSLFLLDSLTAVPLGLYLLLWLGAVLTAPRQDRSRKNVTAWVAILAGTVFAYTANNLLLFLAGWLLTTLPLLLDRNVKAAARLASLTGSLAVAVSIALLASMSSSGTWSISSLSAANLKGGEWAFALLMFAVIQRKGIFPLHFGITGTVETSDLTSASLLLNSHLGALIVARIALPVLGDASRSALALLADLGLLTAVVTAVFALADRQPRRLLGLIWISQSSTILAGLESINAEAITGALIQWMAVSISTTVLFAVLRMIEVRHNEPMSGRAYLGLAGRYPRLAVFFAVSAVALVGLPGTLGFCSEDLLMHGVLETHPWIGLAIPIATALNGFSIYRLFSILFLGKRESASSVVPDATPRERWPIAAFVALLILLGLAPQVAVGLRSQAAHSLSQRESALAEAGAAVVRNIPGVH
jgi:NADH-quinone oxidoreductase subunit M